MSEKKLSRCLRPACAIFAGAVLALSFPGFDVAGFAWIAPALILLSTIGCPPGRAFRLAYLAGFTHYLISLYWLLLIPAGWYPILGWLALSAFIALYPATWAWLVWKIFPSKISTDGDHTKLIHWNIQFLSTPWAKRFIWTLSGAAIWVSLEMLVARFLGGFPWNLLGSSQFRMSPLIQIASYTGIYGVSFLIVWTSLSFLCALMVIIRSPAKRSAWVGEIIIPSLAVAFCYGWGYHKLLRPQPPVPHLTVALIQPSIPQTMIWDEKEDSNRFHQLLQLSQSALHEKCDILLWPEAALPRMLRYDEEISRSVSQLASSNQVWMIVGSDDMEPDPASPKRGNRYFNSSFLASPHGNVVERYNKRNLVIFGEYIPFLKYLPFLKYFTPIEGGFTPGKEVTPFRFGELGAKAAILICFEDVFPHLVRDYVDDDTDFLVNLTNNGWFGEGAAQWQHGAAAVFRAVENGIPLVRCSNNGLTCLIDSSGRITDTFHDAKGTIYGQGFLIVHVPMLAKGEKRIKTYYTLHGDVFGEICIALALLQLVKAWGGRAQQPRSTT